MAEVSCLHGWYNGLKFRFLGDPIVFVHELFWGTEIAYVAPGGGCLFA
jgi:hypothetical protein